MIDKLHFDKYNSIFMDYIQMGSNTNEMNLNKINIFVGENNSGKSRFLRELFKSFRKKEISKENKYDNIDFPFISSDEASLKYEEIFKSYLKKESDELDIKNLEEQVESFKKRFYKPKHYNTIDRKVIEPYPYEQAPQQFLNFLSFNEYAEIIKDTSFTKGGDSQVIKPHNDLHDGFIGEELKRLSNITFSTYIPTMRNLKKISPERELLKERIHKDYFTDLGDYSKLNIFTGESLYDDVKKQVLSLKDEYEKNQDFQQFMKENFFEKGFKLRAAEYLGKRENEEDIINTNKDLLVEIGKEERKIYELGDGILSLIILLFPLFQHRDKNHILFIDEPELNIHPGMQRLFIETLLQENFVNTQIFISTHSNHFLNIATDFSNKISVFSFKKKMDKFEIENISQKAEQALELLGVNNSSVFLSNCTIWIEGISERLYIRHFLKLYTEVKKTKENFKEDFHYSFIEYSGSNLSHWSFCEDQENEFPNINYEAISKNVLVIADKDENKEEKHKLLKERLGEAYKPLPCREIENLLSPKTLRDTLLEYKKVNANENDIKFIEFNYADYKDENIGNYIFKLIDNKEIKSGLLTKPNQQNNRSIADKRGFTKNAIKNIHTWDDLSQEAKDLTEFIYQFIKNNNK